MNCTVPVPAGFTVATRVSAVPGTAVEAGVTLNVVPVGLGTSKT
jgi:hypothetical protein